MLDAHREAAPQVDYVGQETIILKRLDDLDILGGARAPFLKIDTQGFEKSVIEGGAETIARCVGVQLEISFVPLYDGGMLADEAISWGYANGFRIAVIEQGYRSEERRVGKECVRPGRSRGCPYHEKKTRRQKTQ